jgi:hypothetical protein
VGGEGVEDDLTAEIEDSVIMRSYRTWEMKKVL